MRSCSPADAADGFTGGKLLVRPRRSVVSDACVHPVSCACHAGIADIPQVNRKSVSCLRDGRLLGCAGVSESVGWPSLPERIRFPFARFPNSIACGRRRGRPERPRVYLFRQSGKRNRKEKRKTLSYLLQSQSVNIISRLQPGNGLYFSSVVNKGSFRHKKTLKFVTLCNAV